MWVDLAASNCALELLGCIFCSFISFSVQLSHNSQRYVDDAQFDSVFPSCPCLVRSLHTDRPRANTDF